MEGVESVGEMRRRQRCVGEMKDRFWSVGETENGGARTAAVCWGERLRAEGYEEGCEESWEAVRRAGRLLIGLEM